jgi:hypothetical protein
MNVAAFGGTHIGLVHHVHDDKGSMLLRRANPRGKPPILPRSKPRSCTIVRSHSLEGCCGETVTLSPHSNANQAMFTAKDVA